MSIVHAFGGDVDMTGNKILNVTVNDATANNQPVTLLQLLTKIADLVGSAPTTLDTFNELATALGNDPNLATTLTNLISTKSPIANPVFTGTPKIGTKIIATTDQISTNAATVNGVFFRINSSSLQYSADNSTWFTLTQA